MEQPGDGVLDELNKRVAAESLIEKSLSGRVTGNSEVACLSTVRHMGPGLKAPDLSAVFRGLKAPAPSAKSYLLFQGPEGSCSLRKELSATAGLFQGPEGPY